jgi:SOS-response transcriptional repressor LexA
MGGTKRRPLEQWQIDDAARLRALFEAKAGMSQEKFGQAYGIGSQGAVWQYLEGRIPLNLEVALKFADGLKVDVHEISPSLAHLLKPMFLRGGGVAESEKGRYNVSTGPEIKGKVPLISWVQAGAWSTAVDNLHPGDAEEWIPTTVPIHQHTYALRVKGDSMTNPAGDPSFPDGSIIIVEPDAIGDAERMLNQFVIVKRTADDEATFKQLVKDAGRYYLKPLNPRYPMLELREDDVFCGVVRERVMRFF